MIGVGVLYPRVDFEFIVSGEVHPSIHPSSSTHSLAYYSNRLKGGFIINCGRDIHVACIHVADIDIGGGERLDIDEL